jgi:hypothetical protein
MTNKYVTIGITFITKIAIASGGCIVLSAFWRGGV